MMDQFSLQQLHRAMEIDGDKSTHPISFDVMYPSDIRRIFDPISYSKGATMIRMLQSFLGEHTFRLGITEYLQKHSYANAVQSDLWRIMTKMGHEAQSLPADLDIGQIMRPWTHQSGYPVLTVVRNGTNIIISQQKYTLPKKNLNDTTKWYIPITFSTKSNEKMDEIPQYWIKDTERSIEIENVVDIDEYIYLNINRTGYYRVSYDYSSWQKLTVNFKQLPNVTRSQLVDDAFELARAEMITYDIPLTLLIMVRSLEDEVLSWIAISNGIDYISNMIMREPAYESFRAVMRFVIRQPFTAMGFKEREADDHVAALHHARIVALACKFEIDRCTNAAQIVYREWMSNPVENK